MLWHAHTHTHIYIWCAVFTHLRRPCGMLVLMNGMAPCFFSTVTTTLSMTAGWSNIPTTPHEESWPCTRKQEVTYTTNRKSPVFTCVMLCSLILTLYPTLSLMLIGTPYRRPFSDWVLISVSCSTDSIKISVLQFRFLFTSRAFEVWHYTSQFVIPSGFIQTDLNNEHWKLLIICICFSAAFLHFSIIPK